MKFCACVIAFLALCMPSMVQPQDRASIEANFQAWLEDSIWPRANSAGVSRSTFNVALSDVDLNWDLPGLVIPGEPDERRQSQAEFRAPASYFAPGGVTGTVNIGRQMASRHATTLAQIEQQTGVPGQIILSIWGRESSFGRAAIPHDAFEILSTKGFMSNRTAYFTDELVAALRILENGFVTRDQMRSSWAGALGQPQFMPSSYLAYATDGDGDGRVDIWQSERDTLASIASYLKQYGWNPGRDWGFEVVVPATVSCSLEGLDNGRSIQQWLSMGITRVSGRPFPSPEVDEVGYLLMPAGRYGPAFIVTSNFYVLKAYNESDVYALFVGHVGDRIKFGVGDFTGGWGRLSDLSRTGVTAMQHRLEELGYDVGGADGLIGNKTRRSIGLWQEQNDERTTCYPSHELMSDILR
jgi:lytic murein transglycosylase